MGEPEPGPRERMHQSPPFLSNMAAIRFVSALSPATHILGSRRNMVSLTVLRLLEGLSWTELAEDVISFYILGVARLLALSLLEMKAKLTERVQVYTCISYPVSRCEYNSNTPTPPYRASAKIRSIGKVRNCRPVVQFFEMYWATPLDCHCSR
jgi:hypothetical protein